MQILKIEEIEVVLDSTFSMRWVETVNGPAIPTLYKNGKRVTKKWSLQINHNEPEDPYGGNANTN